MPSRGRAIADAVASLAGEYVADQVGVMLTIETPRRSPQINAEDDTPRVWFYPLGLTTERDRRMVVRRPTIAVLFTAPLDDAKPLDVWEEVAEKYMDRLESIATSVAGHSMQGVVSDSIWDPTAASNGRFAALYQLVFAATGVLQ
jgi:hypothetical protein